MTFGAGLRERRRACDLTQRELAALAHCAEITIRKIEPDQLRPSRALTARLIENLGVSRTDQAAIVRLARRR